MAREMRSLTFFETKAIGTSLVTYRSALRKDSVTMHIACTDNILAELASEMDLNSSAASDILDHVLADDDDREFVENEADPIVSPKTRLPRHGKRWVNFGSRKL